MTKLRSRYLKSKFNKKGFTLIELLAIILVLAILILIAIPFITKIVEEASKEAFKQTTKGTATAIEKQCDLQTISDDEITTSYAVDNYKVIAGDSIKVKGRLPLYANASANTNCNVQIVAHNKKWCATKAYDEDKVIVTKYVEGLCKIGNTGPTIVTGNDTWDGWITMTLYYPAGSTDREWRLGSQGEVRYDETLMWQDYKGAITVKLDRVEDVWIRYNLDGKTVTIPPLGTILVDIQPDSYGTSKKVSSVKVKIAYDEDATVKEYRVGDSGWMTYTGEFTVTENTIIEARASKPDNVYDTDGNLVASRKAVGRDAVYIGNIGINETELPAPTIQRLDGTSAGEVAKVKITYPVEADKKIYKMNYGIEENYTDEISIGKYGTHIIAYYYDASGKRSQASAIYINDPNGSGGGGYNPPTDYNPLPPLGPKEKPPVIPTYKVVAPIITGSPTTPTTGSVEVTVTPPVLANSIYIKKGNGNYELYTGPITIKTNTLITAYYVTMNGEISEKGFYYVKNIVEGNKPYLAINASPYPYSTSYGETSVNISLEYSNADTVEYSENGVEYITYTGPFTVNENKTIYARATNSYGTTLRQLSITNIGGTAPKQPDILSVNIMVAPEPAVSSNLVAKVKVKIDYDSRATKKYYTLGKNTPLIEYTGEFEVTENTIIFAYALSSSGKGEASKKIDNLLNGISEPNIIANPTNNSVASSTIISIEYDKNATIKRYSINGGTLRDYVAPIEIQENSTIYAYNSNAKGEEAESTYYVNNINPKPSIFLIDKGYYYILKLNYPEISTGREYKWKKDGIWKTYDEKGILLIKPEYKDKLFDQDDNFKVGVEDDNGDIIDYTNHWYLVDSDFKAIKESIFMRWNTTTPPTPEIVLNTLEPAQQVTATILYNKILIKKEYKVVDKDGNIVQDWTNYNNPININKNNTIIYARGMDETEVWSDTAVYKVINIDELQPVIKLTMDLETATQKLGIKVNVTDDVMVSKIKWAKGTLGESYFTTGGTEILNNSIVNITENAYYTFYAEDGVGNKQVYTINVENIDLTPPIITISATPENMISTTSQVTIDYGDSATKQYKIGSSTTWLTYTAAFNVSSYTVLTNNWQNSDGTVTIYAKGKDSVGNEVIVTKKLVNLDLDMPNKPVIVSNAGYPILTSYGVKFDDVTTITYDSRTDIDNYYSVDGGTTWIVYTEQIHLASGAIIAKSVKKDTGLMVSVSKTISMPADAITINAYDGNDATSVNVPISVLYYMKVDSSMQGKPFRIVWQGDSSNYYLNLVFLNSSKTAISNITETTGKVTESIIQIPEGTEWIRVNQNGWYTGKIYEIQTSNEPTFTATNGYMLLHADPTKSVENPYQMVNISYFPTSVQRLYRIGTTGSWLDYEDKPILVKQGETIYAKGIDQNGNESRKTPSYTANVSNALTKEASDKNDTTFVNISSLRYMKIDSSMQGKKMRILWQSGNTTGSFRVTLNFLNSNKSIISSVVETTATKTESFVDVPTGTEWISITQESYYYTGRIYEIQSSNEPSFSATNGYMLLHADPTKSINKPYQMVNISYFPTSVQRLYRIGTTGSWLDYEDKPILVKQGETIYAKGIDQYGYETRITPSYTANVSNALTTEAFDKNDTTYVSISSLRYMKIDSSMQGKKMRILWQSGNTSGTYRTNLNFLDSNKSIISTITETTAVKTDSLLQIPLGTEWISIALDSYYYPGKIFEIQASNEPVLTATNGYMLLHADPTKSINNPYQMINISYFPTSTSRLYKIGAAGSWINYEDKPILVNQGETIYAKGIDQYGNETRITSSHTVNVTDALPKEAFDKSDSTYVIVSTLRYMKIDSSMQGKSIKVLWQSADTSGSFRTTINFLNSSKAVISSAVEATAKLTNSTLQVPLGTEWISITQGSYYYQGRFYEIQSLN